ncbi:hypothetical protein Tco_1413548 [Tanacetum coccineum]
MVEQEKPLKKKDQIKFDKEVAQRLQAQLQAELEEEERLAKQREEDTNIAEWDDVQTMMDAYYELAARLQAEEQGELTVEEKAKGSDTRAKGCSKRAGEDLQQESTKKQKVEDDDKEKEDLKQCLEIVLGEKVAINAIPLATKHEPIVGFHIHRKGRNENYEIMRANGSTKTYLLFSQLLKEFDKEDMENL